MGLGIEPSELWFIAGQDPGAQLGGVRLSIRPQPQGRLRCGGSGHTFPRVWLQLLEVLSVHHPGVFYWELVTPAPFAWHFPECLDPWRDGGVQCGPHHCTA